MAVPIHIAEAIEEHFGEALIPDYGWYSHSGLQCAGAAFHSPTPLTVVDTWITPIPLPSAPDTDVLIVGLCPTCSGNLSVLKNLLLATNGDLPWVVRREFGNKLRALALRGWERYVKEREGAHAS